MISALASCFIGAFLAPFLHRRFPRGSGILLAFIPLMIFIGVLNGSIVGSLGEGAPTLFYLDGLSRLFVLLISGIGTLILLYTHGYLKGDALQGRFLCYMMAFMGSMLGLAMSNHLLLLFIFWELTSFTSYLLIGYNHESQAARDAALQAMLVTVSGGLALLAGVVLMTDAAGTWYLSDLIYQGDLLRAHEHYIPILVLVALGAFTKSAQFPFHFWLPGAMQAPTPASAYLHSSTMVKAGVYLLARLSPVLGHTPEWSGLLMTVGAITFVGGAVMAAGQHILKRLLAYTTVSALGAMVMLIGVGSKYTIKAMVVFLVAHAFYKAALFMVAGSITHETGKKSVDRLGGLRRVMPFTFVGAIVAGLSMGGFPPLFGFVAKEAWLHSLGSAVGLTVATVVGGAAYVVVGLSVGWKPFVGPAPEGQRAHEAPWLMRLGPIVLGVGSILMALFCGMIGTSFIQPAAMAIYGKTFSVDLHLWEGFNRYFYISMATLVLGVCAFRIRSLFLRGAKTLSILSPFGAEAGYQRGLKGILSLATWLTKRLQTGLLRDYIRVVILFAVALVGVAFWRSGMVFTGAVTAWQPQVVLLAGIMGVAAWAAIFAKSRLGSILCLGIVGYGVAMLFSFYSAPDLAMTQLVIESLTIILIALAFYHLPHKQRISPRATRWTDGLIATLFGGVMMLLVMAAIHVEHVTPVSDYFLNNSYLEAHGRNVVNVILVDFRALDTLGEITVLTVAALGGFALLKLRAKKKEESS